MLASSGCFSPAPPSFPIGQDDAAIADAPVSPPLDTADAPPVMLGPWGTPTPIPGVNTGSSEGDPSLTPDRLTICFSSTRNTGMGDDIFLKTRSAITEPFVVIPLAVVNTTSNERSCHISADGNTIFFTSNRDGNSDVFVTSKLGGVFGAPSPVVELNTASSESDIAISPDGTIALIARGNDMFLTSRGVTGFTPPIVVPELDVTGDVAAPSLTDNANTVYLHAGSPRDLYVASRQGQGFTTPVPITELNTGGRDAAPFVGADDRYLAFERAGDLFETTR
jgi:hypothetical protein